MHRLWVGILLLAVAAAAPAKLYKWVDEQGNVTYSERKPPGRDAKEIKLLGVPAVSNEQARERLDQLNDRADTERKDRDFKQNYASETAEREARLKENCEIARQNLRVLETASRVQGADGGFLDDEQRKARIAQTQQQIEDNCN